MSVLLMEQAKAFVRSTFSQQEVVSVEYYGGEFSGDEVVVSGFRAPAILIAGLGWARPRGNERMVGKGARVCHMVAFVVTNENSRTDRMITAQRLAERLDLALTTWTPANAPGAVLEVAAPEDDVRCENVYGRKVDAKGLALWLVTWRQCVRSQLPLPQLFDLLGLDIKSTSKLAIAEDASAGDAELPIRHELHFVNESTN